MEAGGWNGQASQGIERATHVLYLWKVRGACQLCIGPGMKVKAMFWEGRADSGLRMNRAGRTQEPLDAR